jgi:F-type H+-transporting ATPase subunit beta
MEFIYTIARIYSGISVFCGVGERMREGHELWREMQKRGILENSMLMFGQMSESPGIRFRVPLSAITLAEFFRDEMEKDVLFLVDNIYRFVQAGNEVSVLLGRLSSRVGYQPTLLSELAEVEERLVSTKRGSVTSVQAIYVPADDITDPAVANVFPHLDTTVVLSREIAAKGLYPAIDPLLSTSKFLSPEDVGEKHYEISQAVREHLSRYKELLDIIAMLGIEELSPSDRLIVEGKTSRKVSRSLFPDRRIHRQKGKHVSLNRTIDSCEMILSGKMDVLKAFFMIGDLEEINERGLQIECQHQPVYSREIKHIRLKDETILRCHEKPYRFLTVWFLPLLLQRRNDRKCFLPLTRHPDVRGGTALLHPERFMKAKTRKTCRNN